MTAFRIIKSLSKRGNTVIGAGCYAAALQYKTDTNKVIKVGTNLDDPWLDYYWDIIKDNQHNSCVPKVYSLHVDRQHNFYVCIMEKLIGYAPDRIQENDAKGLVRKYIEGSITRDEWLDAAVEYPKHFPSLGSMLDLMNKIKQRADDYKRLDLHTANILTRASGQLIITDPWCQIEDYMDDMTDVESWVCDNLYVI